MVITTPARFGVAATAVCCWFLLASCGAERGDVSAAGSVERSVAVAPDEETSTASAGPTSTVDSLTANDSPVTLTTAAAATAGDASNSMPTTLEQSTTLEQTTTVVPPPSEAATTTTVPPAVTEPTVPTLEVGGGQSASGRVPDGQTWAPFATFAEVTLFHPSIRVERIGFHESNHDGARQLELAASAIAPIVLESRQRDTGARTAADIVVEPGTEIRAPVTGTVIRAGGYVLYCDHKDDFLVIEPESHPGWEVKLLHINGVMVSAGDRVEAGVTVVAPEATVLPFDSQVDEFTARPPWPHVHIELVDPSIPDRPSTGGGC